MKKVLHLYVTHGAGTGKYRLVYNILANKTNADMQVKVALSNSAKAVHLESVYNLTELMNCHFSVSETLQNMKFLVHINDLGKRFSLEHLS